MDEFFRTFWIVIVGSGATLLATWILKSIYDFIVKALAANNKKLGLFIQKRRRERFNAYAADLINKIDDCKAEISKLNASMIRHLKQDLNEKFEEIKKTKSTADVIEYLNTLQNYVDIGGVEDEVIQYQKARVTALACGAVPKKDKDDDGSLDF